jgi:hypothetical protein
VLIAAEHRGEGTHDGSVVRVLKKVVKKEQPALHQYSEMMPDQSGPKLSGPLNPERG